MTAIYNGGAQSSVLPNITFDGFVYTYSGDLGGTFTNVATPLAAALVLIKAKKALPFAIIVETNETGAGTRFYVYNGSAWKSEDLS